MAKESRRELAALASMVILCTAAAVVIGYRKYSPATHTSDVGFWLLLPSGVLGIFARRVYRGALLGTWIGMVGGAAMTYGAAASGASNVPLLSETFVVDSLIRSAGAGLMCVVAGALGAGLGEVISRCSR